MWLEGGGVGGGGQGRWGISERGEMLLFPLRPFFSYVFEVCPPSPAAADRWGEEPPGCSNKRRRPLAVTDDGHSISVRNIC